MSAQRDPNLNHEAVRLYRQSFLLCPSFGRRQEIVLTVTNLNLWQSVLTEWKEQKWNPLKVSWMLSEYERREKSTNGANAANGRSGKRAGETETVSLGVSERRNSQVPRMPEDAGIRLRAGSETLEKIVTKALRQNHRSQTEVKS